MRLDIQIDNAAAFMVGHARLLDRHRFAVVLQGAGPDHALQALDGYRNPDGGYGWGLEPDLRAAESQPGCALHAFEVFEDVAPATSPRARQLCDWLASVALPDGGLPFGLPVADATATAPFWAQADATVSSLHITAAVTAVAQRVARRDPAVADHAWLAASTRYCLDTIAARDEPESTLELLYSLEFLDAVADTEPDAPALVGRLAAAIPPSGTLAVEGGLADEVIRPLEFSPWPDRPLRHHLTSDVIEADLARLAAEQRPDGGWDIDFHPYSPMAALEWRGYATVRALRILQANGWG